MSSKLLTVLTIFQIGGYVSELTANYNTKIPNMDLSKLVSVGGAPGYNGTDLVSYSVARVGCFILTM